MNIKKVSVAIVFLISTITMFSQNCSKFYPFSEGTTSQITSYGKDQKVIAIIDYTVQDVNNVSGNEIATMITIIKDKEGNPIAETTYEMSCNNDQVSIDFKSMMNPQVMKQFGAMKAEITGTNLSLPNNLAVEQTLPDASIEIKINMAGMNMDIITKIKNREVTGRESITTPAGTFDCYVLTSLTEVVMSMGVNQSSVGKQWISEGVGMVKQEDRNDKGEVTSTSILTTFSK